MTDSFKEGALRSILAAVLLIAAGTGNAHASENSASEPSAAPGSHGQQLRDAVDSVTVPNPSGTVAPSHLAPTPGPSPTRDIMRDVLRGMDERLRHPDPLMTPDPNDRGIGIAHASPTGFKPAPVLPPGGDDRSLVDVSASPTGRTSGYCGHLRPCGAMAQRLPTRGSDGPPTEFQALVEEITGWFYHDDYYDHGSDRWGGLIAMGFIGLILWMTGEVAMRLPNFRVITYCGGVLVLAAAINKNWIWDLFYHRDEYWSANRMSALIAFFLILAGPMLVTHLKSRWNASRSPSKP